MNHKPVFYEGFKKSKETNKKGKQLIIIGLIAIILVISFFISLLSKDKLMNCYIAKVDIKENTVITEDMIIKESRRTSDVGIQKNIILDSKKAIGFRTIAPIYIGEILNSSRFVENKSYMNEVDKTKKNYLSIKLDEKDKALDIKIGSHIDIWEEPTSEGVNAGAISHRLFEAMQVANIKTDVYSDVTANQPQSTSTTTGSTATYLIIGFNDVQMKEYLDIKDWLYKERIALYSPFDDYKITEQKIIQEQEEILNGTNNNNNE